jgi:hypothetical protein
MATRMRTCLAALVTSSETEVNGGTLGEVCTIRIAEIDARSILADPNGNAADAWLEAERRKARAEGRAEGLREGRLVGAGVLPPPRATRPEDEDENWTTEKNRAYGQGFRSGVAETREACAASAEAVGCICSPRENHSPWIGLWILDPPQGGKRVGEYRLAEHDPHCPVSIAALIRSAP